MKCLDPERDKAPFCEDLDLTTHRCKRDRFCPWQQGIDSKGLREHYMTRDVEEVNP